MGKAPRAYGPALAELAPAGTTEVKWLWHGANVFILKLMGVFVDRDRLLGQPFEAGLAKLKGIAETQTLERRIQLLRA